MNYYIDNGKLYAYNENGNTHDLLAVIPADFIVDKERFDNLLNNANETVKLRLKVKELEERDTNGIGVEIDKKLRAAIASFRESIDSIKIDLDNARSYVSEAEDNADSARSYADDASINASDANERLDSANEGISSLCSAIDSLESSLDKDSANEEDNNG